MLKHIVIIVDNIAKRYPERSLSLGLKKSIAANISGCQIKVLKIGNVVIEYMSAYPRVD